MTDFEKYAKGVGVSSLTLHDYINTGIVDRGHVNGDIMNVFDRLMADRIIFLGTEIDSDVADIVQAQLLFLQTENPNKDINMYLNTPGGSVIDGLAIYDTMQLVQPDVSTTCAGLAASMGSILLCGGAKGKRYALPHSRVLIHQPMGGARGQASDILISAKEIDTLRTELYEIISENSGQSMKKVRKDADRDYWMTAKQALEYGMIDEIIKK